MRVLAVLALIGFVSAQNQFGGFERQAFERQGYANVGQAPLPGGSSQGKGVWDSQSGFGTNVNQPLRGNQGNQGSVLARGGQQGDRLGQGNMVNQGAAPVGQGGNSGATNAWDTFGAGAGGAGAAGAPQMSPDFNNNLGQAAIGTGGNSGQGWGNAGFGNQGGAAGNAPLEGALLTDVDQQNADKSDYSSSGGSFGATAAGVVVAVVVLVGVVTVAAVFLVKQRASRTMVEQA